LKAEAWRLATRPLNPSIIVVEKEDRDELPCQYSCKCPDVRWHNFPHKSHPLEEDVGDVEDGQEPLVLGIGLMNRAFALAETSGLGITNVGTVEEGQKI
jgi:hypothetical protein